MTSTKQASNSCSRQERAEATVPCEAKAGIERQASAEDQFESSSQATASSQSKQDRVVAMLRRPEGTTVAAVMKATGWQKHSVHGFFAGVVRKKLGLNVVSEKTDDKRVYRITEGKRTKAAPSSRKRAA